MQLLHSSENNNAIEFYRWCFENLNKNIYRFCDNVLEKKDGYNAIKDFINKHGNGLVSDNGEDEMLLNHAKELLANELRRKEMGEKGYSMLEETFNVKSAANQIVKTKN